MTEQHVNPYEAREFIERWKWHERASKKNLKIIKSLAVWTDICGIGEQLKQAEWDLEVLQRNNIFSSLSSAYIILGESLYLGVAPEPSERVLIINDGIARTLDFDDPKYIEHTKFLWYVRNIMIHHFMLEGILYNSGLGLRTVIAGGERCQYSPEKVTGNSILFYSGEPSTFGKDILQQQFVYNPREFQMNTAFALAYTLDALGTKYGIKPNRLYLENNWVSILENKLPGFIVKRIDGIDFLRNNQVCLSIFFDDQFEVVAKGKKVTVYRVEKFIVREALEGEETIFPMAEHDNWM